MIKNWYVAENKQENLSIESKIELILQYWNLDEIISVLKSNFQIVKKVNNILQKNPILSDKKKKFLKFIIDSYDYNLG